MKVAAESRSSRLVAHLTDDKAAMSPNKLKVDMQWLDSLAIDQACNGALVLGDDLIFDDTGRHRHIMDIQQSLAFDHASRCGVSSAILD